MEQDRVQAYDENDKTEKFCKQNKVFSRCLVLKEKQQLGGKKLHIFLKKKIK